MTDYTQPITLIRLSHYCATSVVEFAYTPRYMKWTVLKYDPAKGQTVMDAWTKHDDDLAFGDQRHDDVSHGNTDLFYADIRKVVGHLALNGWVVNENRPYNGPSGYYECNAANAAEREDVVLF